MTTVDSSPLHPDAIADLKQSIAGSVVLPSDPDYEAASSVYGAVYGHVAAPALVVQPSDADDVGVAVAFARSHQLELSVRIRDSEALIISVAFLPPDAPAEASRRVGALWRRLTTHLQGTYAGFSSAPGGEDLALLYSPNTLSRLMMLKRAYDPENLFRRNHNIRPDLER